SSDSVQIGGAIGNEHKNAPFIVENFYGVMSLISLLMVTAFLNVAAARDFSYNTHQIIFSTPLKKYDFLMGRFWGAVVVAIIPFFGVTIGNIVGSMMPWLDAERVGPLNLLSHINGLIVFVIPNIIFTGAFIFAIAALTRSTIFSFIASILLLVGYGIAQGLTRNLDNEFLAALIDPFGIRTFSIVTKYWTVDDKNTMSLSLQGLMLLNRLIWIGAGMLILAFAYFKFSFSEKISARKKKKLLGEESEINVHSSQPLPSVSFSYTASNTIKQFLNQVRIDFWGVFKSTAFIVIMLAGITNMSASLAFVTDFGYGLKSFPLTYIVIDTIRGTLYLFIVAVITFYTGVLVWKERDAKVNEIYDALPHSHWISFVSKLFAMTLLIAFILLVSIITGLVVQTLFGYYEYNLGEYFLDILVFDLLSMFFLIVMSMLIHTIVNNRYLAYFIFIVFIILNIFIWEPLNISSNMVKFGSIPSYIYSSMNGFNPYMPSVTWFNIYWFLFCGLLVMLGIFFWVRGKETSFKNRLKGGALNFSSGYKIITLLIFIVWIVTTGFVFYNTKILNSFHTSRDQEELIVQYEKLYKKYEHMNIPRITDVKYKIDLFPETRSLKVDALEMMVNRGTTPIDSIHFNTFDGPELIIDIANAKQVLNDEVHHYQIYQLSKPMMPGDSLQLHITTKYVSKGFENNVRFTQIVENGTFFNNADIIPQIGYQVGNELQDKNRRKKCGLPERERMPALTRNCTDKCMDTYLSNNCDWVNVETIMSTSKDQIAVAPGSLIKEWIENDRHYYQYKLDHYSLNFYSFISAKYEVKRDEWKQNDSSAPVKVEVYYMKGHEFNVQKMVDAVKNSLSYYSEHFGPYYHNEARIIEFPRYADFAQAFPGTMPYSEGIGFILNIDDSDAVDMVTYVVAHEMGHQWWAHQVVGANMQGATLLSESMAQYSSLMVQKKLYGKEHMQKFLKYEMDRYLRSRGREAIKEEPLLKVENQGYVHYQKGSVVMYYLQQMIGEEAVNASLKNMIDSFAYRKPPYQNSYDLVDRFTANTPDSLKYLINDLFYDITLFNNRTLDASYKKLSDGKYEVTINVQSEKYKADSLGKETKVATNDWIEIGALAKPAEGKKIGKQIHSQFVKFTSDKNTFTFITNEQPNKAGIDPNYLLVDRMSDDNLKSVTEK
ncbi:MAG: hypothetical protein LH473_00950, partial [Chitinophagales bacterium]|nr:hypothetical protein [Chitinophagales bacterium]